MIDSQLKIESKHCYHQRTYFRIDLIEQSKQKCVEVAKEECKYTPQLPLESYTWMVFLQLSDGLKEHWTHQSQKRHDDLKLRDNGIVIT